jgi:magnesium-transporting ATPase (P-type)
MTTVHRLQDAVHRNQDALVAYTKGSPEEVLAICTGMMQNGKEVPLDGTTRGQILKVDNEYASSGLRVLAVAVRWLPEDIERTPESVEKDLTFLGLVAMMDPPRQGAKEAVEKCRRAGIRIIMITGDYGLTAESIARRLGIARFSQSS